MFTGIVQSIGVVKSITKKGGSIRVIINPNLKHAWKNGESVSVSGVCLTIIARSRNELSFEYMPQTIKRTTVGFWKKGKKVNIEPSLKVGDEISGHFVQGHVDGVARITQIHKTAEQYELKCALPSFIMRYVAKRGAITLDGVSLTVGNVAKNIITVFITPFTFQHTTFQYKKKGCFANVEADMLARYIIKKHV